MRAGLPVVWTAVFAVATGARAQAHAAPIAQAAAPHPAVAASVDVCVPVDAAEFHRLLALELGSDVAYTASAESGTSVTQVRVACVEGGVELRLEDPVTRKSMTRVLSIANLADRSRTRLLALAAAEFVVASWVELSITPAPAIEPVSPAPSVQARQAVSDIVRDRSEPLPPAEPVPEPPGWLLSGALTAQGWTSHDGMLVGGSIRLLRHQFEHLAWTLSADIGVARVDVDAGRVSLTSAGASAALLLRTPARLVRFYVGPGARAGVVRLAGLPDAAGGVSGTSFVAPMLGPIGYGRAEVEVTEHVLAAVEFELGLVTMPARALGEGEPVLELDGAWFTGGLALVAAF